MKLSVVLGLTELITVSSGARLQLPIAIQTKDWYQSCLAVHFQALAATFLHRAVDEK